MPKPAPVWRWARRITHDPVSWAVFLTSASRLYKYSYPDQLMIYAQRPDATACAGYDVWNGTMRRYVKRGSKGIALLTPTAEGVRLRYVFDVSDTGTRRDSRDPDLWTMNERHAEVVSAMLAEAYDVPGNIAFPEQIRRIAENLASDWWEGHSRDVIGSVDGSFLNAYSEAGLRASFLKTAEASIAYGILSRCGQKPEIPREAFEEIRNWNTSAAVAELGTAVSACGEQVLRRIEMTVKRMERSHQYDTELSAERRDPDSRTNRGGAEPAPGQIRKDAAELSAGEPAGTLQPAAPEREPDGAPVGDRGDGPIEAGGDDAKAAGGERRDGEPESGGSDALDGADEQLAESGGGDDPLGTDLRLSGYVPQTEQMGFLIPDESRQIETIESMEAEDAPAAPFAFSVPQEVIDEFLRVGSNTADSRMTLAADFMKQMPAEAVAERMKRLYHGGFGFTLNGVKYSVWYEEDGLRLSGGNGARERRTVQKLSWQDAAKRVGELMESGQFASVLELAL